MGSAWVDPNRDIGLEEGEIQRFQSLESLRAWAAWWVVIAHAVEVAGLSGLFSKYPLAVFTSGGDAVNLFMILSGFVIAHLLIQKPESYRVYLWRRFFRLWPLLTVMTGIAILIQPAYELAYIANPWIGDQAMRVERIALQGDNFVAHFAAHLVMLHGLIPEQVLRYAPSTFLSPAWSTSLEWQFYLVAPLVLAATRTWKAAALFLPVLVLTWFSMRADLWQFGAFLPEMIPFFIVGITLRLWFEWRSGRGSFPWPGVVLAIGSLSIWFLAGDDHVLGLVVRQAFVFMIVAVFFRIALLESRPAGHGRVLGRFAWLVALNPVLRALGKVSFSTYLVHVPVLSLVVGLYVGLTGGQSQLGIVLATILAMLLVAPASFLCFALVERPGVNAGKRMMLRLAHAGT